MVDENKRMIQKTDDERMHDLALLYLDICPEESPSEFYKRYSEVKDLMKAAHKERILEYKQDRSPKSPV